LEYIKNRKLEKQVSLAFYLVNILPMSDNSARKFIHVLIHTFREFEKKSEKNGGGGN
jgi:hypothetical protein